MNNPLMEARGSLVEIQRKRKRKRKTDTVCLTRPARLLADSLELAPANNATVRRYQAKQGRVESQRWQAETCFTKCEN
jgi:hypothetical protein